METITPINSDIESAIAAGKALGMPINLGPGNSDSAAQVVIIPDKYKALALEPLIEKYRPLPIRVEAFPKFETLDSLLDYVIEFKGENTRIFVQSPAANLNIIAVAPSILVIMDYHDSQTDQVTPHWCAHKALYASRFSIEWQRWTAANAKRMSQADFATFLEENASLVISPPGAELLELVSTLEGHADITCNQLIRLPNGRAKLVYDENVTLSGQVTSQPGAIEFPTALIVQIAPFDGGAAYKITCRLRYRIENRRLTFWFECVDLHLIVKECVGDMIERITEKTELTPFIGTPS